MCSWFVCLLPSGYLICLLGGEWVVWWITRLVWVLACVCWWLLRGCFGDFAFVVLVCDFCAGLDLMVCGVCFWCFICDSGAVLIVLLLLVKFCYIVVGWVASDGCCWGLFVVVRSWVWVAVCWFVIRLSGLVLVAKLFIVRWFNSALFTAYFSLVVFA